MEGLYVQYGCGLSAPKEWINFDVSPTLRLQQLPLIGALLRSQLNTVFPQHVQYGNIVNGLPNISPNSCDGVYCSHVLEHLSYEDFYKAIENSYSILKPGGRFRLVLPDLALIVDQYQMKLKNGDPKASVHFMNATILGVKKNPKGLKAITEGIWGNAMHRWMWDPISMEYSLKEAGFSSVRRAEFNDSDDPMFKLVEESDRFKGAMAFEAVKS